MADRLAIFDFDGTLADSFPFFLSVIDTLADRHGFHRIDRSRVDEYRHYGAREIMSKVGLPGWKLPLVAKDYIALMRHDGVDVPLFAGIGEALHELSERGVTLAVVSSNGYENVARALGAETVRRIRHFECGMSMFGKAPRIRKVLRAAGVSAREALYVGDQISDLEAARQAGVAFGAVAWGYAAMAALQARAPEECFDEVAALKRIAPAH